MKAHNEVAPAPTGDVPQVDGTGAVTSTVSKKRSAGFWAVLFMGKAQVDVYPIL